MGNTDSKLIIYKEHLLRLATDEIIPLYGTSTSTDSLISSKTGQTNGNAKSADFAAGAGKNATSNGLNNGNTDFKNILSPFDPFYTNLVSADLPPQYLSTYLNTTELRAILQHNKTNFTNLLHFLTYSIIQYSSFPKSLKDPNNRRSLTNCLRILCKLIPVLFEQSDLEGCLEAEVFWSKTIWPNVLSLNSGHSEVSNTATVGIPDSPFNSSSGNTNSSSINSTSVNVDYKPSPQDSLRVTIPNQQDPLDPCFLGAKLLSALVALSSQEGFVYGSEVISQTSPLSSVHYDIHLLDILRLFITLLSKPLYKPSQTNRFLESFLIDSNSAFKIHELASSLLKAIVRFDPRVIDPIKKSLFYTSLQFFNITMKFTSEDDEQIILLFFQTLSPKMVADKIYQPLQDILSIIIEGEDLSNFQSCLPIFQFLFNLFLLNPETRTELSSRFGTVLLTTLIIYAKVISQERYCKPMLQFVAHFMAYLSSLPQIHQMSSSNLKSCQLTFLSEKVRNQPISIREFCIIQLVRHIIPILTTQDAVVDPCYIETLYNLLRIPSSLNYSACMSVQNLLTTFHESIQLPVTYSSHYSHSLSFKLDLLSVLIHALVSNILEDFQHNKILLFVLCRNEAVLQQLLQLIENLSQDESRNKPLAPAMIIKESDFPLPILHGHKSFIERLNFDYNLLDSDITLVKLRPSWPIGMSLRSKQKLKWDSVLAKTWLGNKYAYALIKAIQIINSEFPSILKITRKEDLKRVLLHLKIFEPTLMKLMKPVIPLPLTRRNTTCRYLSWDHFSWMKEKSVAYWFDYLLWSDVFNSTSDKVYISEQDIDSFGPLSSPGNSNSGSGSGTVNSRQSNRLERFNSNGSILSRTNTNDDMKPKNSFEHVPGNNRDISGNGVSPNNNTSNNNNNINSNNSNNMNSNNGNSSGNNRNSGSSSSSWFRMPWSSHDDGKNHNNNSTNNTNSHVTENMEYYKTLSKPNIWTGTNIRLFPLVVEECESEFSFVDMTSSLLKRLRFNSTASLSSMETYHTLNTNYT
ncbi:Ecm30 [Kluyveromyces marxianus]